MFAHARRDYLRVDFIIIARNARHVLAKFLAEGHRRTFLTYVSYVLIERRGKENSEQARLPAKLRENIGITPDRAKLILRALR